MGFDLEELGYTDISPVVSERTAVFPGDTPYTRMIELDFARGDHLLLSKIQTSVHIGAHTDAPNHYTCAGPGISERSLKHYAGACQVITVKLPRCSRILPDHIAHVSIRARRVIFRADSFPDPERWNSDFNS